MSKLLRHRLRTGGPEIVVRIVRSPQRKRTIALQLAPDGRATLRVPLGTKQTKLDEVLRTKTAWLENRLSGALGEIPKPNPPREFVAGETFLFLGRQRRLKLSVGAAEDRVQLEGEFLHVIAREKKPPSREQIRTRLKAWFVEQAKEFLPQRVARWTSKVAIREIPRILIGDQTRRWASCAPGGVLRFNWRLAGAPVSLIDYVIAHELCHLRHPDHSAAFWRKLTQVMPDRLHRERELQTIGGLLGY